MSFNPIIYIDGDVADRLGTQLIQSFANAFTSLLGTQVDILTHGQSERHGEARFVGLPTRSAAQARDLLTKEFIGFGDQQPSGD